MCRDIGQAAVLSQTIFHALRLLFATAFSSGTLQLTKTKINHMEEI